MRPSHAQCNRKTQTSSLSLGRIKRLEDAILLVLWHARTGVTYFKPDKFAGNFSRQANFAALRCCLQVNPESDERYRECWQAYHKLMVRRGVTPAIAKETLRRKPTVIGAMLLKLGYADGLICGMTGQYSHHLGVISQIIGKRQGVHTLAPACWMVFQSAEWSCSPRQSAGSRGKPGQGLRLS